MARRRAVLTLMSAVVALIVGASPALAGSSAAPAGAVGHDVSYPQCAGTGSSSTTVGSLTGQFGIVGVTNGLPWSANPCLASEHGWASGLPYQPGLYVNTANPAPRSSFYWPVSGRSDPALCIDSTSTTDPGCAYDYGWHAAANALSTAVASVPGAAVDSWWLDVETANSWNGNGTANTADLQGAADFLRSNGVPSVGIYTSSYAWSTITGDYTVNTAMTYQSAWSSEFTARYPLSQSPTWVAGAGTSATASSTCAAVAFTGTVPHLAQYNDGSGYDADLVCGTPPPTTPNIAVSLNPASGAVKAGGSKRSTVTVAEQGAIQSVAVNASSDPAGPHVAVTPATLNGPGSATLTVSTARSTPPGTYTVTVVATGPSARSSATYTLTVR